MGRLFLQCQKCLYTTLGRDKYLRVVSIAIVSFHMISIILLCTSVKSLLLQPVTMDLKISKRIFFLNNL